MRLRRPVDPKTVNTVRCSESLDSTSVTLSRKCEMSSVVGEPSSIDSQNSEFWDTLCGTHLAKELGVTDNSPVSLKRFDDWYFEFYPYLHAHIPFGRLSGKRVLEVGLGYGTVAQRIAEAGGLYTGLDIAAGPVEMVNHRMRQGNLLGSAQKGSILAAPFSDASFDYVVAIGCLHHTGDLARAISECHRILVPGGSLRLMVYYAYSYRRFVQARMETARYCLRETFGYRGVVGTSTNSQRAGYDTDTEGNSAPHTDWISARSLKVVCSKAGFSEFSSTCENIDQERPFQDRKRNELLSTMWPRICGLDIYATATK